MDNVTTPAVRRARPIYRVFVSSTWNDLQPERKALMDALNRMEEMRFVGMEFFGNRPDDTHDASIDQVDRCEVLVGIIGFRHGSGITEAEYRRARQLGLPCFVYFKRDDLSRPELTDGDPALAAKLAAFKSDLMRGHTVKEFSSPEELAANATADLHNWVAARWISLEREAPAAAPTPVALPDADRTNILRLLERIQHDWVEGVLEASLHRKAWMDLGLDWKDEAVEQPWDRILVVPDRPVKTLGDRETIVGVFASAQNTLLILGEPGAGKTTTLLELARDLVRRARESAGVPPPVVLALSTWTGRHRTLADWLADEMNLRYQVPKRLGRAWLDGGRLVLLLDGLDEVREEIRDACVTAINAFALEHDPAGLAVTCRVVEYSALKERLRLRSAICLQPLTPAQIDAYFQRAGAGLENLRAAMRADEALRALAQSPLLLSVMTMAWRDAPTGSWRANEATTVEQRRTQLFEAYVQTALRRKGTKEGEGHGKDLLGVLPWLARQMHTRGQTLFAVEQLQPDWLKQQAAYFLLTRVLAVLLLALPVMFFPLPGVVKLAVLTEGLGMGIALAAFDFITFRRTTKPFGSLFRAGVLAGICYAPALMCLFFEPTSEVLLATLIFFGIFIVATVSSLQDVKTHDIRPVDAIGWSWAQSGRRAVTAGAFIEWILIVTLLITAAAEGWHKAAELFGIHGVGYWPGLVIGLILAFLVAWRRKWSGLLLVAGGSPILALCADLSHTIGHWDSSSTIRLGIVLTIGFMVALGGGLTAGIDETRVRRAGAWFWLKVPLLAALVVGSAVAVGVGGYIAVISANLPDMAKIAGTAGAVGGACGLIAFFRFGGFQGVQHFILRRLLAREGPLPRNPAMLLDHAARLNLLQKVGFGYRFIHALLLDHLAARAPEK